MNVDPGERCVRSSRCMRWALATIGILLTLVGGVWILQGTGFLKGSSMTGSSKWLVIGVVCVVIGLPLAVRGLRTARR